ncbi:MAG: hypothetical protein IJ608_09045 [Lachnospiraceae bacterium]|nr:hypothetical protein [Lachnospiraceae bacterium]
MVKDEKNFKDIAAITDDDLEGVSGGLFVGAIPEIKGQNVIQKASNTVFVGGTPKASGLMQKGEAPKASNAIYTQAPGTETKIPTPGVNFEPGTGIQGAPTYLA